MIFEHELCESMTESILFNKKEIQEAIQFIRQITDFKPRIGLVLGSGLGEFGQNIAAASSIPSANIPYYPISTVQGHAGKLIFGYLHNDTAHSIPLLIFQGRVHYYEIGSVKRVVFPIILARYLGIKKLILTNASGGINSCFAAGDLMLIQDILNFSSIQIPVSHKDSSFSQRSHFDYFDEKMKETVLQCASQLKIRIQHGTYCCFRGPSYETPAEIQMLKRIGVDAVGMSTVPEVFVAHKLGMKIVGISLISNLAAGISPIKLSHADVTKTGTKVTERFSQLMEQLVLSLKH
jgi:purine-nucleoside phosphorylase